MLQEFTNGRAKKKYIYIHKHKHKHKDKDKDKGKGKNKLSNICSGPTNNIQTHDYCYN